MNIVIVDDSPTNLMLLSQLARQVGGNPLKFQEPLRALIAGPQLDADLVIVDYSMPGMNGLEVVRALRGCVWAADLPIIMITSNDELAVRHAALELGVTDFLRRPLDTIEVRSRLKNLLKLREAQKALSDRAAWLAREVAAATLTIAEREEEIILRLSRAAEFRDSDTGAHIIRMAQYCRILAEGLGMDHDQCRLIYLAAPMHDVGKIGVRDAILLKAGRLTAEERVEIEKHTLYAEEILSGSSSPLIELGREIAVTHHERWDGAGYPRGLRGHEIPVCGRIAAVADVFDALTSERPYKSAWSTERARDFIAEGSGKQFDPECVAAFEDQWEAVLSVYRSAQPASGRLENDTKIRLMAEK